MKTFVITWETGLIQRVPNCCNHFAMALVSELRLHSSKKFTYHWE